MLFEKPEAARQINREKTGAGSAKGRRASRGRWDDSDIAASAAALLAWHDVDPEYAVLLKIERGWITLSGHVDWPFKKAAVEQDVRRLLGVTGVTNTIEVRADVAASGRSDVTQHDAGRHSDHNLFRAAE